MNEENPTQELKPIKQLETMYKEYWEHSRHCEKEMFWFTNIYVVVVAAILAFMRDTNNGLTLVLVSFGLILSVFGLFIVIALTQGHHNYITNIVTTCYRWDVMEFYANPKKAFYYKRVHRWFFEITIVLFAALTLYHGHQIWEPLAVFREHLIWLIGASVIIWITIKILYRCEWNAYTWDLRGYRKVLRNDIEGHYRNDWDTWFRDPKFPEFWEKIVRDARKRGVLEQRKPRICRIFWRNKENSSKKEEKGNRRKEDKEKN